MYLYLYLFMSLYLWPFAFPVFRSLFLAAAAFELHFKPIIKQTHLFSLKPAQTHTHSQHWRSLWLHYSVFPTHSLIPPNSLSPPHSIFLSLSLSSASPSASQVLILLSFHTIFQHRLPLLSLFSCSLYKCCQTVSSD